MIWNQFLGKTRHQLTPWSGVAALRPEEDVIAVAGYRVILNHWQIPAIGTLSAIWMQAGAWFNRLNTTIRSARMRPTAVQRAARRVARNAAHLVTDTKRNMPSPLSTRMVSQLLRAAIDL